MKHLYLLLSIVSLLLPSCNDQKKTDFVDIKEFAFIGYQNELPDSGDYRLTYFFQTLDSGSCYSGKRSFGDKSIFAKKGTYTEKLDSIMDMGYYFTRSNPNPAKSQIPHTPFYIMKFVLEDDSVVVRYTENDVPSTVLNLHKTLIKSLEDKSGSDFISQGQFTLEIPCNPVKLE